MKNSLLVITMILALGGLAYAGSSRGPSLIGASSGPITPATTYNILDTRGGVIYNAILNGNGSNAVMTIYDTNGLFNGAPEVGANGEVLIMELETSSSVYTASVNMTAAPMQTFQGITVSVSTGGTGFLNYQP
jgi:hypothetical protein